jgi:acetyl esterase/lipase
MLSENDQRFLERWEREFLVQMRARRASGDTTVEGYRTGIARLEPFKNTTSATEPKIATYYPEVVVDGELKAAVAVPDGNGPFPVFVIIHGNGMCAGSSHSYRRLTADIAGQGYLAVTPDFRLAPENPFPAGYEDCKRTVYWARSVAQDYGGDPERIVLWGDSMAAPVAFSIMLDLLEQPDAPPVRAFVGVEGIYDFERNHLVDFYLAGNRALLEDRRVSPQRHLAGLGGLPGIFLITGTEDQAFEPTMSFAAALHEHGHKFELHVLEGMPHDFMKFPEMDGMRAGHRLMQEFLDGGL